MTPPGQQLSKRAARGWNPGLPNLQSGLATPHGGSPKPNALRVPPAGLSTRSSAGGGGHARGRQAAAACARPPGIPTRPDEAAGSGKGNMRGTEPQAVTTHSPQLCV